MKREHQLFLNSALALSLLVGAGCDAVNQNPNNDPPQDTPTFTPFMPATPTPFMPLYQATPTFTPTSTHTETLLPTFTLTPTEFFYRNGVEFNNEVEEIFVNVLNINFSYFPLLYPDGLPKEERDKIVKQDFAPGNHRGLTKTDGRVIILELHSGWVQKGNIWEEDEAEGLRNFLEGNSDSTVLDPSYIENQIKLLVGSSVTFNQDGNEAKYIVAGIGIIPHEVKSQFDSQIKATLDWAIRVNPDFQIFKEKDGGILISFCGWGPNGDPEKYIYKDYIIGLLPTE